jgi:hypothetical protein
MAVQDYYVARTDQLLRDFDRHIRFAQRPLAGRYGADAEAIIGAARQEYAALIPDLPYIGGGQNPLTWNLVTAAWFLALYRVLKGRGARAAEVGGILYQMVENWLHSYPGWLLRLLGWWRFTRLGLGRLTARARRSQARRYPGDWVYSVVPGAGHTFAYGVDYSECGILKFYRAHDADEMLPYLCWLDFPMTRAYGMVMTRRQTLAQGGAVCDFRFAKRD